VMLAFNDSRGNEEHNDPDDAPVDPCFGTEFDSKAN